MNASIKSRLEGVEADPPITRAHDTAAKTANPANADGARPPAPLPLRRQSPPAESYPLNALGSVLEDAARAIMDKIQCPDAIAAQSVLGAASLAIQGHADVVHPKTGKFRPTSLFLVTVAASGERKSAADAEALSPIRKREAAMRQRYDDSLPDYLNAQAAFAKAREHALKMAKGDAAAGRTALNALGAAPLPPLQPMLTASEPTLSGLHKLFAIGEPALGLFSDEAGGFIGGHGMNDDNRLRMATGLSELWDGSPINRVRSGDGSSILPGRRLAAHLMVQPGVAERLLANSELQDQGLLGRMLVAAPESRIGTRFQRENEANSEAALSRYEAALLGILERPLPFDRAQNEGLTPRRLELERDARCIWVDFADKVERRLAPGKAFEPIRAFGGKLPEHALRMAAVLELIDNPDAPEIGADAFKRAEMLAEFYAGEALRLFDAGAVAQPIREAEKLLHWLRTGWGRAQIGLKDIYQRGPNSIREANKARRLMELLAAHGFVKTIERGATIEGKRHREAWSIRAGGL